MSADLISTTEAAIRTALLESLQRKDGYTYQPASDIDRSGIHVDISDQVAPNPRRTQANSGFEATLTHDATVGYQLKLAFDRADPSCNSVYSNLMNIVMHPDTYCDHRINFGPKVEITLTSLKLRELTATLNHVLPDDLQIGTTGQDQGGQSWAARR